MLTGWGMHHVLLWNIISCKLIDEQPDWNQNDNLTKGTTR